ncbi:hypothetical protein GCM10023238_00580 [Streptomyces heliomycini]
MSCLQLAVASDGREITTVEGLADGDRLHPVQQPSSTWTASSAATAPPARSVRPSPSSRSTRRAGPAPSPGTCVPKRGPPPLTPEEFRERMSGNLCRCSAYVQIVEAVARAAAEHRGETEGAVA